MTSPLDRLGYFATDNGVTLQLERHANWLSLDWIERTTGEPGAGATVIEAVCEYADSEGLSVHLEAMNGASALVAYYERLGFARLAGNSPHMHRAPR
jgi:hypothetical protein